MRPEQQPTIRCVEPSAGERVSEGRETKRLRLCPCYFR